MKEPGKRWIRSIFRIRIRRKTDVDKLQHEKKCGRQQEKRKNQIFYRLVSLTITGVFFIPQPANLFAQQFEYIKRLEHEPPVFFDIESPRMFILQNIFALFVLLFKRYLFLFHQMKSGRPRQPFHIYNRFPHSSFLSQHNKISFISQKGKYTHEKKKLDMGCWCHFDGRAFGMPGTGKRGPENVLIG